MRGPSGRVRPRTAAVTALAAATVMVTAGPAAAGAAVAVAGEDNGEKGARKLLTSGLTDAAGVHLQLGEPLSGQLGGQLNGFRLDVAGAHGTHRFGDPCRSRATEATADAAIASGTGVTDDVGGQTPFAVLNRSAHADLSTPGPVADSYGRIPDNPLLSGELGPVQAKVTPKPGNSNARSKVVDLTIGPLGQELPADSLHRLTKRMRTAGKDLQRTLEGVLPDITGVLGDIARTQPDSQAGTRARELRSNLTDLQERLPVLLDQLPETALLEMRGLAAHQRITRTGDGVRAAAEARLASASLLGGLLTIDGFHNSATASTGGEPGTAHAKARPQAFDVEIAGLLDATYGPHGLSLPAVDELPDGPQQRLDEPLNQVLNQLTALLSQSGLTLDLATHRVKEADNGTSAIAESGGLLVGFQPPGTKEAAFGLVIGQAVASVAAEYRQGDCRQAPPAAPAPPEGEEPPPLAYTGPRIPYSGMVGGGLLAVAGLLTALLVVSRRRRNA